MESNKPVADADNKPWILLDRDGVINKDSPNYIRSAEEWEALPGSLDAIAALKKAGYPIAVVTNQSGLSRGLFDLDDLEAMHNKLQSQLAERDAAVDAIFYCPHVPEDECNCRKPKTGMLDALEKEFATEVSGSWMVGDRIKDLQLGLSKGCQPVLVLTGKGEQSQTELSSISELKTTRVFQDLGAFAQAVLQNTV